MQRVEAVPGGRVDGSVADDEIFPSFEFQFRFPFYTVRANLELRAQERIGRARNNFASSQSRLGDPPSLLKELRRIGRRSKSTGGVTLERRL